jgi:CBS domain-containing protein
MASDIKKLDEVLTVLQQGRTATPVTIRNFLSWFGAQRRTAANVDYINTRLDKVGIRTVPDYLSIDVDTPITFELVADHPLEDFDDQQSCEQSETDFFQDMKAESDEKSASDPSFRIGKIASANNPPLSVKPNSSLLEATTLMLSRNFSQLPVMTTDREVKGVISWESIGARSATSSNGGDVQSYMDEHHEVPATASLFVAIKTIVEHNYVLIRASDKKISGIVTATDIALQFEEISTPFLLLAEIENSVRALISSKLKISDIKRACSEDHLPADISQISDLTFGNYVKVLEHPDNWKKVGLQLDRITFCSELADINTIRNDVMHFDPDPLTSQSLSKLRNVAKMLDLLRSMRAF